MWLRRADTWCLDCFRCVRLMPVLERGIVGMLEEQQQKKRNCTEVLFFITKDIKLGYLSAQGRALLIYFYLMTLIIVSKLSYFLLFYWNCWVFLLLSSLLFFVTSVSFTWCFNWLELVTGEGSIRLGTSALQISHSKISSQWQIKEWFTLFKVVPFFSSSFCSQCGNNDGIILIFEGGEGGSLPCSIFSVYRRGCCMG